MRLRSILRLRNKNNSQLYCLLSKTLKEKNTYEKEMKQEGKIKHLMLVTVKYRNDANGR